MAKFLIINGGWEQIPLIKKIYKQDHRIYLINDKKPEKDLLSIIDDYLVTDFSDLSSIRKFGEAIKPDAVISDECDYSFFTQAYLANLFNLPGPNIQEAQISCNKLLQRKLGKSKGINQPKFLLVKSPNELKYASDHIGFPLIIKPIDNRGSFGVKKVLNKNELYQAFFDSLQYCKSKLLLVEEFIEGLEITIDGFCFNDKGCVSLTCGSKRKEVDGLPVATDIIYPAEINPILRRDIMLLNESINNKLGYQFGMTHSEYILNANNDLFLIESANRGGGCYTSQFIVKECSGIDIVQSHIDSALGLEIKSPSKIESNSVLLKFFQLKKGQLKKIEISNKIKKDNRVLSYRVNVNKNEFIERIDSDASRHGFIIVKGSTQLRKDFLNIFNKYFTFEYE